MPSSNRAPRKNKIGFQEIEAYRRQGLNDAQIGELVDLSKQRIGQIRAEHGVQTPRKLRREAFPWDPDQKYKNVSVLRLVRIHLEYVQTGGKDMPQNSKERLRAWYELLQEFNAVIEFDPEIPPVVGVSKVGGFAYRDRTPEDEDYVLRVNEHTKVTDENDRLLRLPPKWPKV